MTDQLIVRKHNDMIEAQYQLTLPEMRILLLCVAQQDLERRLIERESFYIEAKEYVKVFGISSKSVYADIKKAVNRLWHRDMIIHRPHDKPLRVRWLDAMGVDAHAPAEVVFGDYVGPYLTGLREKGCFTQYDLKNVGKLSTFHSYRLYELMAQYRKLRKRRISLAEFRRIMALEHSYPRNSDMVKHVITPSLADINDNTDIAVVMTPWKEGRTLRGFDFDITVKTPQVMPIKPKEDTHTKYLAPSQLYREFQKRKYQGKSYAECFQKARELGYTFDEKAFCAKYAS